MVLTYWYLMILVLNVINIAHSCFVVAMYIVGLHFNHSSHSSHSFYGMVSRLTLGIFMLVRKILWGIIDVMVWARTKENNSEKNILSSYSAPFFRSRTLFSRPFINSTPHPPFNRFTLSQRKNERKLLVGQYLHILFFDWLRKGWFISSLNRKSINDIVIRRLYVL